MNLLNIPFPPFPKDWDVETKLNEDLTRKAYMGKNFQGITRLVEKWKESIKIKWSLVM